MAEAQAAPPADGDAGAGELHPPTVLHSESPQYPPAQLASGEQPTVVLDVTVAVDGTLSAVNVHDSAGELFDRAALEAVELWRFSPALRGDQPIASRVTVAMHFALPQLATFRADARLAPVVAPETSVGAEPARDEAGEDGPSYGAHAIAQQELRAGASDFQIRIGALRNVPRNNATDLLKLAPGILLTNEAGEGHAEQIYMRGFDARAGQDIEFSAQGVPINDTGNLHGNGYADTHFVIPELVSELRVVEGPFSVMQGNYAVAGSADYQLGLESPGLTAKLSSGSWNSKRALLSWGPAEGYRHTFAGVEVHETSGFGSNRAAKRATAMTQYEIRLGEGATLRIGAQAYATQFQSADLVRQDDWAAGKVDFYGTQDPEQGGNAARFSTYAIYEQRAGALRFSQTAFAIRRAMRLRENFTGFLLDTQNALDTLHAQRGDLLDAHFDATVLGGRGSASWNRELFGLMQTLEVGYYARVDLSRATQYRNAATTDVPYRLLTDLDTTTGDLALYADAALRPASWITLRGGVRLNSFFYDVLNNCAAQGDFDNPSRLDPPLNESCHDQVQYGTHREPVQRSSTAALKTLPRVNLLLGPWKDLTLTGSYGQGVRSIDPIYVAQDLNIPFASVRAYEGGAAYGHDFGPVRVSARSVFFVTKVDRDLIFNQTVGRNTLASGTTRRGWLAAVRVNAKHLDSSTNVTFTHARFDDTGLAIPYVPTWVVREDASTFGELPWKPWKRAIQASASLGYSYVSSRPLPYGEHGNVISVVDGSASIGWAGWELALSVTNLLNRRYHLGEYNYPSDFRTQPQPTLVPSRMFTAGAPRGVFLSLATTLGAPS